MNFSDKYVYLIALIPFCTLWILLCVFNPKLRKEIITISLLVGGASVATSYLWWTKDWWRPQTITGTIVGVEDFIMGFTTGGIMSVAYNLLLNPTIYKRKIPTSKFLGWFVIASMSIVTGLLLSFFGLTTFWASVCGMTSVILLIVYLRKDLLFDSLVSGILMVLVSVLFYTFILFLSDTWLDATYLHGLSGLRISNIPVEEFIFWFLAGMWVGPFYEFAHGIKYRK